MPNDLLDAQSLLSFALGKDRTWLIVNYREPLASAADRLFADLIGRRAAGEPLQYIIGRQEFYGLDFEVSPAVLIPRPESELIIEEALRLTSIAGWSSPLFVDVGTGSGCLAITLAREVPSARIVAIDISAPALEVAKRNATASGVADRIEFIKGDLLCSFDGKAAIIVSNPPYVARSEMDGLQREVRDWEPRLALTDEADGLSLHRRLLDQAPARLHRDGYLICELGYQQASTVRKLLQQTAGQHWGPPRFLTDLQGIERTIILQPQPPASPE